MTDEATDLLPLAHQALSRGWSILPNRGHDGDEQSYKRPAVSWTPYQDRRATAAEINDWFGGSNGHGEATGMFVVCGPISGLVVLDIDDDRAAAWWAERIGGAMATTVQATSGSGRGRHFYFEHPTWPVRSASRKNDPESGSWDLRARGAGVVVPPSLHGSGRRYAWVAERGWGETGAETWPWTDDDLASATLVDGSRPGGRTPSDRVERSGGAGAGRSTLAWLLDNPGVGGRNTWVTQVAGHLAKRWPWEDAYRSMMDRMVWPLVSQVGGDHEYTRKEYEATVASVWKSERRSAGTRVVAEYGWLRGNGQQLYSEKRIGESDKTEGVEWSNFDLQARALLRDPDGTWLYQIDTRRLPGGGENMDIEDGEALLPAETLGSTDRFNRWLAARRLVVYTPKGDLHANLKASARIQMYLDAQGAPEHEIAPWMGWNDVPKAESGTGADGVYVCAEGVIDHAGLVTDAPLVVDPRKEEAGGTAWTYGRDGDPLSAAADLATVLSFHDPVVTSLLGAIWALAPIKGLLMSAGSIFPQIAIVATSEAGKTNGFFDLMMQANGRRHPGGMYTAASLRDDLSRHRGGWVWIDDPSNIDDLGDLLRAAASEGSYTKRAGAQWDRQSRIRLVAPTVVSAEGLAALQERAMADRLVRLDVPSPTGRRSLLEGKGAQPQWDDVLAFQRSTNGGLWQQAGWYVQMAMVAVEDIRRAAGVPSAAQAISQMLEDLRPTGMSGRLAERQAMIRLGARMVQAMARGDLAEVSGADWWSSGAPIEIPDVGNDGRWLPLVDLVDDWIIGEVKQEQTGSRTGPYVIEVMLPAWLSTMGYLPKYQQAPAMVCFVGTDGHVYFHQGGLVSWWQVEGQRRGYGSRGLQLGSGEGVMMEVRRHPWTTRSVKGKRYVKLDAPASKRVLEKAGFQTLIEGVDPEEWDQTAEAPGSPVLDLQDGEGV